jgi:hypothetical protein
VHGVVSKLLPQVTIAKSATIIVTTGKEPTGGVCRESNTLAATQSNRRLPITRAKTADPVAAIATTASSSKNETLKAIENKHVTSLLSETIHVQRLESKSSPS